MIIEKASGDEHKILSEITKLSKAFWGYSPEQMAQWDFDLTITEEYINQHFTYKLIFESTIIGYYSFYILEKQTIKLDNLFVLPDYIGSGFGNQLLLDFLNRIKEITDIKTIVLDADPNAEKFYQKYGFTTIGHAKTTIENRFLPVMELKLTGIIY